MSRNVGDETTNGRDRTTVLEWGFPYLLKGINYENETND
jgi:hypothetical protein